VFPGDNENVPEETPEQIEARLARYADRLRRARGAPIDDATRRTISQAASGVRTLPPRSALQSLTGGLSAPSAVSAAPAYPSARATLGAAAPVHAQPPAAPLQYMPPAPAPTQWPQSAARRFVFSSPGFTDVRVTLLGHWLAAAGAAGAVLAFIVLDTVVASVLVLAVLAVGVAAIAGHRSLAWWWTLGVLAGALLGRFS
jgi:hypothetical protein